MREVETLKQFKLSSKEAAKVKALLVTDVILSVSQGMVKQLFRLEAIQLICHHVESSRILLLSISHERH